MRNYYLIIVFIKFIHDKNNKKRAVKVKIPNPNELFIYSHKLAWISN